MKKILLSIIILAGVSLSAQAQQFSLFNQQYDNLFLINPAYAGSDGAPIAHLHYRSQWAGFEGHPETMVATFDMPLELKNSSAGGMILRDRTGVLTRTGIRAAYAYTAKFNDKASLNFGLSAGVIVNNIDFGELTAGDQNDQILTQRDGKAEGDVNFGVVFKYDRFEAGLSTYYLLDEIRGESENQFTTRAFSHTTLITSYRIPTSNEKLEFKPILTYRFATVSPGQLDALLSAEWNKQFKLAVGYRSDFGVLVTAGAEINNRFYIGYGYEYGTSGFGPYARNSHEIMLRVRFGKDIPKETALPTEKTPVETTEKVTEPADDATVEDVIENPFKEATITDAAYNALNVPEDDYKATFNGNGYVLNSINYSSSATQIPTEGLQELEKIRAFLLKNPKVKLEIGGFTSNQGDANVNILKSKKRAQTILEYLEKKGVNPARLSAVGYGSAKPIRDNGSREGRILNERIEIKVLDGLE